MSPFTRQINQKWLVEAQADLNAADPVTMGHDGRDVTASSARGCGVLARENWGGAPARGVAGAERVRRWRAAIAAPALPLSHLPSTHLNTSPHTCLPRTHAPALRGGVERGGEGCGASGVRTTARVLCLGSRVANTLVDATPKTPSNIMTLDGAICISAARAARAFSLSVSVCFCVTLSQQTCESECVRASVCIFCCVCNCVCLCMSLSLSLFSLLFKFCLCTSAPARQRSSKQWVDAS
eukprot:190654-Rhodomonas_salina.3